MTRAVGSASPMMRLVAATAAFASVYFLVAAMTGWLTGDSGSAVLWPASGVYLGVMLVAPRHMWSPLACAAGIGSLAAYLQAGSSLEVSIAFAVPSSAEGLLGALLVERIAGRRLTLGGLHDLFALVLGGAVVANALVGLSAGAVAAQTFHVSFAESWLRWCSADALGVIAVAPIITAPLHSWRLRAVALGGLGVAVVATYFTVDGQVYLVQAFLAGLLLSSLVAAVTLTEREGAVAERDRAVTERDRLREGSAETLEDAGHRVARLTAELAARSAELSEVRRRRERLAEEVRDSQAATGRTEHKLGDTKVALANAEQELDGLRRELALAAAERERVQTELDDSALALGRLQAKLGDTAGELARAHAEQARTTEQHARATSGRRAAEHALEQARAQFAEQREGLERSLEEATERLARAEAERRKLAERASELSARYDHRGTCLDASPTFCGLLGYEPEELLGRPGAELLHLDDRPRLARARASRSESTFEARLRRKAGDFVWVEVSLRPVWDRGEQRLLEIRTTFRDISGEHAADRGWRFPQAQTAA